MEPTLKIFSGDELKAMRHELWAVLQTAVLQAVKEGKTKDACDLTAAALKTIQTTDETSITVAGDETRVDEFRELIAKAYAPDTPTA